MVFTRQLAYLPMLECTAAIFEIYISKLLHWFKSYGDFGEQGDFYLLVELHREGSEPGAAGLFLLLLLNPADAWHKICNRE